MCAECEAGGKPCLYVKVKRAVAATRRLGYQIRAGDPSPWSRVSDRLPTNGCKLIGLVLAGAEGADPLQITTISVRRQSTQQAKPTPPQNKNQPRLLFTMSLEAANDADILAHVDQFWQRRKPNSPVYQFLLDDIALTYASKGVVRARLLLTKNHVNTHGGIHGSVTATLIDWVGGIAIAAYDNRDKAGVSTDIHISYQSSAKVGDWVEIEGRVGKVGGTLAFTTATIWKVVDDKIGPIIATGSHTKYVKV